MCLVAAGCAEPLPDQEPPRAEIVLEQTAAQFSTRAGLRRVPLPADLFVVQRVRGELPPDVAEQEIILRLPAARIDLDELTLILEDQGIPVAFHFDRNNTLSGDSEDDLALRNQTVPFRRFEGTLGGLMTKLNKTMGLAYWWDADALFLSAQERYLVTLPQNPEILKEVAEELAGFGAEDLVESVNGSVVYYSARPPQNEEIIRPYLRRVGENFSEIAIQVALVSVTLDDNDQRGFDFDQFAATIQTGNQITGAGDGTLTQLDSQQILTNLLRSGVGLFGTEAALNVTGAIQFLSSFGRTDIEQNIEVRTLSGQQATIESGRTFPIVRETIVDRGQDSGTDIVTEFDEVTVSLRITLTPRFDADTELVTIDLELDNESLESENPLPEIVGEPPSTLTQNLTDLVRVPAGETVILGGLSTTTISEGRNAPFGLWRIGASDRSVGRTSLFIILRPMVTVYELIDDEDDDVRIAKLDAANAEQAARAERADPAPVNPTQPTRPSDRGPGVEPGPAAAAGAPPAAPGARYFGRVLSGILDGSDDTTEE